MAVFLFRPTYIGFLMLHLTMFQFSEAEDYDQSKVTMLHEVINESLELNTHEILASKSFQKKPLDILAKPSDFSSAKAYKAHAVAFDFSPGDLEEFHGRILPGEKSNFGERQLFQNASDEEFAHIKDNKAILRVGVSKQMPHELSKESEIVNSNADSEKKTSPTEMINSEMLSTETNLNSSVSVGSVRQNIFKIMSKTKHSVQSKVKDGGNDFLKINDPKSFGINLNSIDADFEVGLVNSTGLQTNLNVLQLVVNLYNHFYWKPSVIQTKVSPACGAAVRSYLSALESSHDWAQKAYDSSGHYRGQLLFGSNKWLGQRSFCLEVNRNLPRGNKNHFEFEYFVATIHITAWIPKNLTAELQLGECLPKSCTIEDVEAIIRSDPHAEMIVAALGNKSNIQAKLVRTVSGQYCAWKDTKFVLFCIICTILICVVLTATWYESELNEKKRLQQCLEDTKADLNVGMNPEFKVKASEAYQMTQITEEAQPDNMNFVADLKKNIKEDEKMGKIKQKITSGNANIAPSAQLCSGIYHIRSASKMKNQYIGLHKQILLCFAFQKNASTILAVDKKTENQTSSVHGLRVISLLWTIMVHTYLQMFNIGENRFLRVITERSFLYQFVGNATFSVDTFFFISGFLVTLLFLKDKDKNKKETNETDNYIRRCLRQSVLIVIWRYIRLTPAYVFVILFNQISLRYFFDRSVFQPTVNLNSCSDFWWRNIVYVNNFFPLNQMCMIWSWYMANDMQFYIMATLLLVFSTRYFKTSVAILLAFLMSSWGVSVLVSLQNNFTHKVADPFESFNFLYDKPWQRVGVYIVGMVTGYIMYVKKTPPKISFRLNMALWTGSLGLLFLIICGVWSGKLSVIPTALYVSFGHTAFGLGLVWIVLSCCWGLANPVNKVLSYPGLLPFSRLTYCTYLIHPVIMLLTSFQMEGTVHLNNLLIWIIFLGNAVLSFAVAFLISVILEAPVVRLLKILFKK